MPRSKVDPQREMEYKVTNFLYPVGKPEFDPILTWEEIEEFRQFRLDQQAEWERDRVDTVRSV